VPGYRKYNRNQLLMGHCFVQSRGNPELLNDNLRRGHLSGCETYVRKKEIREAGGLPVCFYCLPPGKNIQSFNLYCFKMLSVHFVYFVLNDYLNTKMKRSKPRRNALSMPLNG
jgi:hypothetical protein